MSRETRNGRNDALKRRPSPPLLINYTRKTFPVNAPAPFFRSTSLPFPPPYQPLLSPPPEKPRRFSKNQTPTPNAATEPQF